MRKTFLLAWFALGTAFVSSTWAGDTPHVVREDIEWARSWILGVNQTNKPHVLLIGDSITEAYGGPVERLLANDAYVSRLATSKSLGDPAYLQEVALVLQNVPFDVVHFNNGMHGDGYSEEEYQRDFPKLIHAIRSGAPHAKLICATTTAKRMDHQLVQFHPFNDRIKVRNRIAREFADREKIVVDDLYGLVEDHAEFFGDDGTHFKGPGIEAEARQVAESVRALLPRPTDQANAPTSGSGQASSEPKPLAEGVRATIRVNLTEPAVAFSRMLFGGFIEHFDGQIYGGIFEPGSPLADERGFRKDVIAALKELKLSIVRWPGGCFASGYHWKNGVGPHRQPVPDPVWGVVDPNTFGTDEFVAWCREVGCEPYLCSNAGNGTPEEMRDWVEYCNGRDSTYARLRIANRHPEPLHVRYWSIGNENWGRTRSAPGHPKSGDL